MQLTRTSNKLKRTILFNAERGGTPFFAPPHTGYFSLILIKQAVGYITIDTKSGARVSFPIQHPMAICLRDNECLTLLYQHGIIKVRKAPSKPIKGERI